VKEVILSRNWRSVVDTATHKKTEIDRWDRERYEIQGGAVATTKGKLCPVHFYILK